MRAEPKRPATQQGQRGLSPHEREHVGMLGCQGLRIVNTDDHKAASVAAKPRPTTSAERAQQTDGLFK